MMWGMIGLFRSFAMLRVTRRIVVILGVAKD